MTDMTDQPDDNDAPEPTGRSANVGSQDAGQTFDDDRGRIFPCERCGADLEFHIGLQKLTCPYCGFVRDIELSPDAAVQERDLRAMLKKLQQWREEADEETESDADGTDPTASRHAVQELRCDSCGGNVEFTGTLTSTRCPYCGSPLQLEKAHRREQKRIPVDGVLPFQIDRRSAAASLKQWVQSRWFAPGDFRRRGVDGEFNGIYLSYFTFDAMTFTVWKGRRGVHYYVTVGSGKNRRSVRRTRWTRVSGRFQRFFDDVPVLANTGFRRDFMMALEPWPLQKVVPFTQQFLAGYLARTYDLELDVCFQEARSRIEEYIERQVRRSIGGDTQEIVSIRSRWDALTFRHLLLPVWLMAYSYRGRVYQVFINAASGEVQGERPWSIIKITLAALAGAAVLGGLWFWSVR